MIAVVACSSGPTVDTSPSSDPPPTATTATEGLTGWRRVDFAATATTIALAADPAVLLVEGDDDRLRVVRLDWDGDIQPIPAPDPVLSVRPDRILVAADGVTLRYLEFDNGWAGEPLEVRVPPPAPDLEPVAYWWGDEDEGPIPVVAYRQPDGRVGLHSMGWSPGEFDPEPGLFVDPGSLDRVRVSAKEGLTVVAGPVGPDPENLPDTDRIWTIWNDEDFDADGDPVPRRWREEKLEPEPDAITDVAGWVLDVWVAGRNGNRPLLWHADDPAVAVETRDGPALLFPTASGWERLDLPEGRLVDIGVYGPLNAGGSAEGARVIAVVDGAIWIRHPD